MKLWYAFSKGKADGNRQQRDLLGGKGANLAEMCNLGIPVPPGFTLPTTLCNRYYADGSKLATDVLEAIDQGISYIESHMNGAKFGFADKPVLVSVRSGARESMPGMMDTVLNIGLNRETVNGLAKSSNNRRFALDSYRRLIQMYGDVVKGVPKEALDAPLDDYKAHKKIAIDSELSADDLDVIIDKLLGVYQQHTGEAFPEDPRVQLRTAIGAVFGSWHGKRAKTYRALNKIPEEWGTAANVQAMVFGNFGDTSATGVAFSRDPSTGANRVMGEWLPNAQGEDVVAGTRTPGPLDERDAKSSEVGSLEKKLPKTYSQFVELMQRLEKHYRDMQDIEFTVQEGELFILQTRNGKRTAAAALALAVSMVKEGLIDERTAVSRVSPEQVDQLMHPQIDPKADKVLLAKGLPASPGAASGLVVIDPDEAETRAKKGESVILVRRETSPEDIHGMHAARGILTATGGMTSHAAVVARGMGRPCIAGCDALKIDDAAGTVTVRTPGGEKILKIGDEITLDGACGEVYAGIVPTVEAELSGDFGTFMQWVDTVRTKKVRANADTPEDAAVAVELGAEGIGLCRTEHMFFAPERIRAVREMILAADEAGRRKALAKIEPMQRQDFVGIFKAMAGKPVTIRFLDPPLHEFLPHADSEIVAIAKDIGVEAQVLRQKVESLHEFNPMLGHRGCRLGLTYPEIYEMQARAVLEAACDVDAAGTSVLPEIMIPLILGAEELRRTREQVIAVSEDVFQRRGRKVEFLVGTMIELPRAALIADQVAVHADFFSFGTNDLTQTAMGLSRDDAGRFLPVYVELGILPTDPFASLDQTGVGRLVKMGTELGRQTKPNLKVGVCGEHGGDPASVHFFAQVGLDYVSCSPYRIPVARLALAHAALRAQDNLAT
ncbi:MAG: pyruvate, phosphate dikinase [Myxococcota bacterium]